MTPKDVTQPRDKDGALNLLNCLTIKRENNPSNIETSKVKIIVHITKALKYWKGKL